MFNRLLDQMQDLMTFAVIALVFGVLRLLMMPGAQPIMTYIASIAASVPVGTIVGGLCLEFGLGDISSMAIASLASLLAHDLLTGIMKNRDFLGKLIKRAAENLTDKVTK